MENIFLFIGENSFLLRLERQRWVQEFQKKHGDENCITLDGQKLVFSDVLDDVAVLPFLAEKRLVVIDGIPKCEREDIHLLVKIIHPNVVLLFCDSKPDKRTTGVKELIATAKVKEFSLLKGASLSQWLVKVAESMGTSLERGTVDLLIEYLGEDMDLLLLEIQKLSLYARGRAISRNDVELLTLPSDEGIVWRMTDLLCAGSRIEALKYAKRMQERGGDAYGLWSILLSMLKNLVLVRSSVDGGIISSKEVSDKTGVLIFALRSLMPYAKRVTNSSLTHFLQWAVKADRDLKTGIIRASDEAPQELAVLVDQFILHTP
jgi:DNA polymerase-3 subunit delta